MIKILNFFPRITVRLGEHEIKNEFSPEKDCNDNYFYETCNKIYQDLDVEDVIINPKYRPRPVEINDIALIRLKTKVKRHGIYIHSTLNIFITFLDSSSISSHISCYYQKYTF